ncbi:HAD family hydrolase [Aeromonas sp. S41-2]|uniref:HAD family hydrolase n=1 Tax=Aeromonas sp. S41-2 TaxID=2990502 RepID=UPI0022E8DDAA|nr:HAD-IA family hydrolase [Aeromonas sp. S41-2]
MLPNNLVWVFDLDDTLFSELEYQTSGYQAICKVIKSLYDKDIYSVIDDAVKGNKDVLSEICYFLGLPLALKDSFIWIYRLHAPDITLREGVVDFLLKVEPFSKAIAIITDGRSVSQRLKISSLGLDHYEILVSEEWQETKPQLGRFEYLQKKYLDASGFVYVGDNLTKDFVGPNKLGWITIGIKDSGQNIHPQIINSVDSDHLPKFWVNNFYELQDFIC